MADNARWNGFELRPSDIVISTPPKCGTTWTQMLCALLIFDGPDFPGSLSDLSPWLDQSIRTVDEVHSRYESQRHRRFIKTHTPLDGVPMRDDVTYVVVGRDPRDVMISMEHHWANMDWDRVLALREQAIGNDDLGTLPPRMQPSADPAERFRAFVKLDQFTGAVNLTQVLHHFDTAWLRRHQDNIVMCHFADYSRNLPAELLRLAGALGFDITPTRALELAKEAGLDRMRTRADDVIPNANRFWVDHRAFFRSGGTGEWRTRVGDDDMAEYWEVVTKIASPQLADWAHEGRLQSGVDPAAG